MKPSDCVNRSSGVVHVLQRDCTRALDVQEHMSTRGWTVRGVCLGATNVRHIVYVLCVCMCSGRSKLNIIEQEFKYAEKTEFWRLKEEEDMRRTIQVKREQALLDAKRIERARRIKEENRIRKGIISAVKNQPSSDNAHQLLDMYVTPLPVPSPVALTKSSILASEPVIPNQIIGFLDQIGLVVAKSAGVFCFMSRGVADGLGGGRRRRSSTNGLRTELQRGGADFFFGVMY
jgi:hypothetical protein